LTSSVYRVAQGRRHRSPTMPARGRPRQRGGAGRVEVTCRPRPRRGPAAWPWPPRNSSSVRAPEPWSWARSFSRATGRQRARDPACGRGRVRRDLAGRGEGLLHLVVVHVLVRAGPGPAEGHVRSAGAGYRKSMAASLQRHCRRSLAFWASNSCFGEDALILELGELLELVDHVGRGGRGAGCGAGAACTYCGLRLAAVAGCSTAALPGPTSGWPAAGRPGSTLRSRSPRPRPCGRRLVGVRAWCSSFLWDQPSLLQWHRATPRWRRAGHSRRRPARAAAAQGLGERCGPAFLEQQDGGGRAGLDHRRRVGESRSRRAGPKRPPRRSSGRARRRRRLSLSSAATSDPSSPASRTGGPGSV
jgi:hypothetical protein